MRPFAVLLLTLLVVSCSALRPISESTRCPESQALRCLTAVECSHDRMRGCQVCRCSSSTAPPVRAPDVPAPVVR